MRALCWFGPHDVRVENVPDPKILNPRDAIVRVTSTAICGSDLHLYNGYVPTIVQGDILGHEFMGEVVELGPSVKNLSVGDRVIVPFPIACGNCFSCQDEMYSVCENSNPNAWLQEKMWGHQTAGIFGYSHLTGGYAGGQAEYVRVPYADVGPLVVPEGLSDDQVLFLTDVLPTGWMAAEACDIGPGDTVAVWGCGPVGLFAIKSAFLLGAERVIAIDRFTERLRMAEAWGAITVDYETVELDEALEELTAGRGPDHCIDAVGMEAHAPGMQGLYDQLKFKLGLATDRPTALRQALVSCRSGGTLSVPGVYGGWVDKVPMGSLMNRSITVKTGQTHVQRYTRPLLERIQNGQIDPSFIVTHRMPLEEAPRGYEIFLKKQEECVKVVLTP